jgi:murein DD-endopeptidase MepM/ murein hydrolase activator NlpD
MDFAQTLRPHAGSFAPVVPVDTATRFAALDFTETNTALTGALLNDTAAFSAYITQTLQRERATYGIGGYAEHRTIYSRSAVFDSGDEPRRLHLGTDIWGLVGTPVYAPLRATVHSFAFNDAFGDYGATLILRHTLGSLVFHTLYGHLSLASIQNIREGETVEQGDRIGTFGEPHENGHWPPHLHFQIIIDLTGYKGDYPGVCRFSERESYLSNSPNPDLILNLNRLLR